MTDTLSLVNRIAAHIPTSVRLRLVCEALDTGADIRALVAAYDAPPDIGGRVCVGCGNTFHVENLFSDTPCPACGDTRSVNGGY